MNRGVNIKNVSAGTWARLIVLILTLLNTVLGILGKNPVIADTAEGRIVSIAALCLSALAAYWKNNSFTEAALVADEVMKQMKEKNGQG